MSSFLHKASEEIRKEADRFIEELKSGKIPKRTLPNSSPDFPGSESFDSVLNLLESPAFKVSIQKSYESK